MQFKITDIFITTIDPLQVTATLIIALLAGGYIYFIYKKTFMGVMYSRNFNISLVMITLVTSLMLMLINDNLTLSMGMVGALSIIRFRTAVKDPIDTVFMFWAVGEGIAVGTAHYDVALIAGFIIGLIMVLLNLFKFRISMPYLLILQYQKEASEPVKQMIDDIPNARIKSKRSNNDGVELTVEVRLRDNDTAFVDQFMSVNGVDDVALISHQGDIVS